MTRPRSTHAPNTRHLEGNRNPPKARFRPWELRLIRRMDPRLGHCPLILFANPSDQTHCPWKKYKFSGTLLANEPIPHPFLPFCDSLPLTLSLSSCALQPSPHPLTSFFTDIDHIRLYPLRWTHTSSSPFFQTNLKGSAPLQTNSLGSMPHRPISLTFLLMLRHLGSRSQRLTVSSVKPPSCHHMSCSAIPFRAIPLALHFVLFWWVSSTCATNGYITDLVHRL